MNKQGDISNLRENCRNKRLTSTEKKIIGTIISNRWTTEIDLFHKNSINYNNASVNTIKSLLDEEGLNTYIPRIIPLIKPENKLKRIDFCMKRK